MLYAGKLIDVMTGDFYLFSHSHDVLYHISIMLYVMQMQTIMYGNHHTSCTNIQDVRRLTVNMKWIHVINTCRHFLNGVVS